MWIVIMRKPKLLKNQCCQLPVFELRDFLSIRFYVKTIKPEIHQNFWNCPNHQSFVNSFHEKSEENISWNHLFYVKMLLSRNFCQKSVRGYFRQINGWLISRKIWAWSRFIGGGPNLRTPGVRRRTPRTPGGPLFFLLVCRPLHYFFQAVF